jgi:hypothetical protein
MELSITRKQTKVDGSRKRWLLYGLIGVLFGLFSRNAKKMHFDEEGMSLKEWSSLLANGEPANPDAFISKVKELNLRNSNFVASYYCYVLS